jgi:preprotein translocase subunit YajC
MLILTLSTFLGAASKTTTTSSAGSLVFFVVILGLFFVMYRFFMKPRQRAAQAQRNTLLALEPGDEVLTGAGIFGTVQTIQGDRVTLWTGTGSTITVLRRTIARKIEEGDPDYDVGEAQEAAEHDSWDDDDTAALEAHQDHDDGHETQNPATGIAGAIGAAGAQGTAQPPNANTNGSADANDDANLSDKIEKLTSPEPKAEDDDR